MVHQGIWIGIVIGVFFAGLGIGYAALQSSIPAMPMMMGPQQMQQMINDPQKMNQWHNQMMQNPQAMNQWMNTMMNDPQAMQAIMNQMMSDPQLSQQMYGMMTQHNQFMQGMINDPNFQNQWMGPMMNQGMMNQGMMNQGMMGSGMMYPQGSSSLQSLQTSSEPQTRTFDIILDEVKFFANVEDEQGQEETVLVELHQWNPSLIVVNEGDTVVLNTSNPRKHTHTFSIPEFGMTTKVLEPRTGSQTVSFVADKAGVFTFSCGLPYDAASGQCDPDHSMMTGTLIVLG